MELLATREGQASIVSALNDITSAVSAGNTVDKIYNSMMQSYGYPFTASTSADMTDQSKIYVYVGTTDSNFTNGNWYYYDGSAWVSGGVYNSIAVSTDTTLSVAGKPADAEATGDEIKKTKAEMSLFGVDDLLWDNTNPSNNTQNKVTWTVDKVNKTVTVTTDGAATGTSVINFYALTSPFPSWLEKGKKYRLHYNDNGSGIFFRIQYNTSSSTERTLLTTYSDADFVIPVEATAIRIRLSTPASASGHTYNTVLKPFISEAKTLFQLEGADNDILKLINEGIGTMFPTWESGGINTTTGLNYTDNTKVRTDFIAVDNGDKYAVSNPGTVVTPILYYDSNKDFVSFESVSNSTLYISVPSGVEYIRLQASDTAYPSTPITADFGRKVKFYRLDGALYNALQYMGIRWYALYSSTFTTIADLPTNTFARVPRDYLDTDVETLPYYNEIEYYVMTIGTPYSRNKTQIAIDPKWNCFYVRRFNVASNVWEEWSLIGKEIQRTYTDADLDENQVILLSSDYVDNYFFNKAQRINANANYKSKLIPVKKGTTIYLNATGGAALPYAKIHQWMIDEIAEDEYFNGYITFDYDGFLAVNCYKTSYDKFVCKVFLDNSKIVDDVQFVNALQKPGIIPEYDPDNVCRVLNRGSSMMGAIHSWGIIGASWDCGEFNHTVPGFGQKELEWEEYSCWTILKKLNGIPNMYIYADGGQNAKEWISLGANSVRGYAYDSDTEVVNPYWSGRSGIGHFGGCWWKMKQDYENGDVKQAFYVGLGGNDIANNYPFNDDNTGRADTYDATRYYECGTIEDIGTYDLETDTDTVPAGKTAGVVPGVVNSFCAYIGAILNRLIAIQPNCIIFLATPKNSFGATLYPLQIWEQYRDAIYQIAQMPQYTNNVYVMPVGEGLENLRATEWRRFYLGNHPNAMGYHFLAYYYNTMIDSIILNNYVRMKQSMYIGTDKEWNESDL